uniref:CIPK7 n=2 Tax=Arundo donax TaxID=35708 RepID=A0A0A9E0S0_ARUDO
MKYPSFAPARPSRSTVCSGDAVVMNRFSRTRLLSPNSPDRSSPADMEMMSNAFSAGGAWNASSRSSWPPRRPPSWESTLRERLNHGWLASSATARRVAGLGSRRRDKRRRAGCDTHRGTAYSRRCALRHMSAMLESSKGRWPARRTKRMTPQDHASALAPS